MGVIMAKLDWIRSTDAAELLGICHKTLLSWFRRGLNYRRISRKVFYVRLSEIDRFIEETGKQNEISRLIEDVMND
jgi:predicted site-specific integrase-resolvase